MINFFKSLKPPFYIAIINENNNQDSFNEEISPIDKMVSIAPQQPGFLGLETTKDWKGNWVTISYWSDIDAENAWEQIGDNQIRKHFNSTALKETCEISVSQINNKYVSSKMLYASSWSLPKTIMSSSLGALIISSLSLITLIINHKASH